MINLKNKRILVTGADGFIGSHLVEKLCKSSSSIKAMCLYNSFNSWGWLDYVDPHIIKNTEIVLGDVRDKKIVDGLCKNVDVVFHLASLIAIPHSYDSPYSYLQTNSEGTLNVMESSLKNNVEKVVHTSTSEVYGNYNSIPISEHSLTYAKSPYAATKIAADQIAYSYFSSFELPVAIIRPFNTYGPRQSNRAIIPTIITQVLNNSKLVKLGSLYPTRDFSYIDDTVDGFIAMAKNDKSIGEIINIGSGYEISISNLFNIICSIIEKYPKIHQEKMRIRPKKGEVYRLKADNKKAKKLINWEPKYKNKKGIKDGLIKTIHWFSDKNNLKKYKSTEYVK